MLVVTCVAHITHRLFSIPRAVSVRSSRDLRQGSDLPAALKSVSSCHEQRDAETHANRVHTIGDHPQFASDQSVCEPLIVGWHTRDQALHRVVCPKEGGDQPVGGRAYTHLNVAVTEA